MAIWRTLMKEHTESKCTIFTNVCQYNTSGHTLHFPDRLTEFLSLWLVVFSSHFLLVVQFPSHSPNINSKQKMSSYDSFKGKFFTSRFVSISLVLMETEIKSKWSCCNWKFLAAVRSELKISSNDSKLQSSVGLLPHELWKECVQLSWFEMI